MDRPGPEKDGLRPNQHLDLMRRYRDAGPTYPKLVIDEFAPVTFLEDCGLDNQEVIACAPSELPAGYAARRTRALHPGVRA